MAILAQNVLNNHFSLEYFILKWNLPHFINYVKEEKINIDYICFAYARGYVHYLVTLDYRLIMIKKQSNTENQIIDYKYQSLDHNEYMIYYNNYSMLISKSYKNNIESLDLRIKDTPLYLLPMTKKEKDISNNVIKFQHVVYKANITIHPSDRIFFDSAAQLSAFRNITFKTITFAKYFNEYIYILPNTEEIVFNSSFNQILPPELLPPMLKTIVFGANYKQPINLPNIETLVLGSIYNLVLVPNTLPSLKNLTLGADYNQIFDPTAFPQLEELRLGNNYQKRLYLPNTIKKLYYRVNYEKFLKQFKLDYKDCEIIKD